MNKSQINRD